MNKLVLKIHEYLEQASSGNVKIDRKLLKEFGERCQSNLLKQLEPEERGEFRLRMSNIGRPLRQLMLEQQNGRTKPNAEFILKMLFGDLYESLMLYLIKASGINVTAQDVKVTLPIETDKGIINIDGMLDLEIDNEVWDIKSASPWSFDNKFDASTILNSKDDFGYVDQLFGYAKARGNKAGGWLPINKSNGQIKACPVDKNLHDTVMDKSYETIKAKVKHITEGKPMPECTGVIKETFYGKSTGNEILGPSCKFCSCKEICHPGIQYKPSVISKSKNPKWEYYTKLKKDNKNVQSA